MMKYSDMTEAHKMVLNIIVSNGGYCWDMDFGCGACPFNNTGNCCSGQKMIDQINDLIFQDKQLELFTKEEMEAK